MTRNVKETFISCGTLLGWYFIHFILLYCILSYFDLKSVLEDKLLYFNNPVFIKHITGRPRHFHIENNKYPEACEQRLPWMHSKVVLVER